VFSHEFAPQAVGDERPRKKAARRPSTSSVVSLYFASVPLFADCSKRELKLLAKTAVVEPRAAGATLVTEGQTGTSAFVILQGKCGVLRKGRRVGEVKAGGVVGELSMLNRGPRNATVVAESALEVAILGRREFLALLDTSPSIRLKLLTSLAARVQELDDRTSA
jgi:CRP/FNR family transcriptional regulator, cyclic AMP receptor protein